METPPAYRFLTMDEGFDRSESTDQTLLRLGGVGLKNVDQRLHLQFRKPHHMEIDSKANSYTKITLYLPFRPAMNIHRGGTKVLASQLFWIVEQDAVVEWALLR